jgi:hypothetical protein
MHLRQRTVTVPKKSGSVDGKEKRPRSKKKLKNTGLTFNQFLE